MQQLHNYTEEIIYELESRFDKGYSLFMDFIDRKTEYHAVADPKLFDKIYQRVMTYFVEARKEILNFDDNVEEFIKQEFEEKSTDIDWDDYINTSDFNDDWEFASDLLFRDFEENYSELMEYIKEWKNDRDLLNKMNEIEEEVDKMREELPEIRSNVAKMMVEETFN